MRPCLELDGTDLGAVLDDLGGRGVLQVLVEGGASVARSFHAAGLVDRYVVYLAPALFGGDDGRGLFAGPGAADARRRLARSNCRRAPPGRRSPPGPGRKLTCSPASSRSSGRSSPATAARLRIAARAVLDGAAIGDSTAVNGCCLTVVALDRAEGWWEADVSDETYRPHEPGRPRRRVTR